jgi:uncharacterized membrane protein
VIARAPSRSSLSSRPAAVAAPVPAPVDVEAPRRRARADWALLVVVVVGAAWRLWHLGAQLYTFDEAFTAVAARQPLGDLLHFLRHADSHPPLDYLIRLPFARGSFDLVALRLPSVLFSVGALAIFAGWMRRRGWVGVLATFFMAVGAFPVFFGREARMYALLELLGVLAAVVADAWSRRPRGRLALAIGVIVLLASLDHVSGLVLGAGLLVVPGRRRDRDARHWQTGVLAGLAAWCLLWGPSFLDQAGAKTNSWIPPTSVRSLVQAVGRLVTLTYAPETLMFVLVVAGYVALRRWDGQLGRTAWCCSVLPIAGFAAMGLVSPVLIERSLTVAAWAAPLSLAALVGELASRRRLLAVVVGGLVTLLVVTSGIDVLRERWEPDAVTRHARAVTRPGDVVAVAPGWWSPLFEYGVAVAGGADPKPTSAPIANAVAFRIGTATPTGRTWLVTRRVDRAAIETFEPCSDDWFDGVFHVRCVRVPGTGGG